MAKINNLSHFEKKCIRNYTNNNPKSKWNFSSLNKKLREDNSLSKFEFHYTLALKNAIRNHPVNKPGTLYRGMKLSLEALEKLNLYKDGNFQKNVNVELKGFVSTSVKYKIAEKFARNKKINGLKVIFIIHFFNIKGMSITNLSHFKDEEEILFDKLKFYVKDFKIENGYLKFYCDAY